MLHHNIRKVLVRKAIEFLANGEQPTLVRINQFDDGTILVRLEWAEPKPPKYAKVINGVWLSFDGPADALARTTWTYGPQANHLETLKRVNPPEQLLAVNSVEADDQL